VKNPVSKFAFQVHNLRRYSEEAKDRLVVSISNDKKQLKDLEDKVGRCRLNQVDP
jgi:hypothetical protein